MRRRTFLAGFSLAAQCAFSSIPERKAKVIKLFKSPDGHPNGLESTKEGLWIGEQTSDRAHLVTWSGKLIRSVETECANTSGIAVGGGYLWMASNGKAIGRPARSTDSPTGQVIQADLKTGATIKRHVVPGGGGVHGLEFAEGKLWITSLSLKKLTLVDTTDFKIIRQIPVMLDRAHGLAFVREKGKARIWCMHSTEMQIHKLDAETGELLEKIILSKSDPDPHGMCMHRGHLYYCDAGIAPGGVASHSPSAGYIAKIV